MPIYIYQGNSQISTNAIRNDKAVKAIYVKEQGKDAVCVWGVGLTTGFLTYTKDATSVTITGLKQGIPWTFLIIPDTIENLPVTTIASNAFNGNTNLKHIELPNSLTSIGDSAFSGCSSLESITIPFVGAKSGVTSSDTDQYPFGYIFGTSSYNGGVATEQYYYGSSTSSTTSTTYYIPSSLKSVTVTGGNILRGAFYNCNGLTSVVIPDSVTSIGTSAFAGCSGLTSITIPDSVTSIGGSAFYNCTGLTSIIIPNSVINISSVAFSNCTGIMSIIVDERNAKYHSAGNCIIETATKTLILGCKTSVIPTDGSVTSIGAYAFRGCKGLTDITIPDSVISIGSFAFESCKGLTSIRIPDSVTSIEDAFWYCYKLMNITGSATNVSAVAKQAFPFSFTVNITSGTNIGQDALLGCEGLTSVIIGNSVTSIGASAFYRCIGLTSITIPNSVTSIGAEAFRFCNKLTNITFNGTIAQWNAISKATTWNYETGNYTIHCTDGDIPKQ